MRLRNIPGSKEKMIESEYTINTPCDYKGKWNSFFNNTNPLHIEIGMGKGKFITSLAILNPDINYIGIEKYSSVLLRAIEKMEDMEEDRRCKNLIFIRMEAEEIEDVFENDIKEDKIIQIEKNDASQAQIIQGCIVDSFNSEKCAKISVLNNILGSSGLSSRLFVNLRDKQGLAYTVRSQYETLLHSGVFSMYIGTDPKNIQKSLNGFRDELQKLANTPVSDEELKGAKENISGRIKYLSQNNAQIASIKGYEYMMGLGLNYNDLYLDDVNNVSKEDIMNIAKMLLNTPKLNCIIAPKE